MLFLPKYGTRMVCAAARPVCHTTSVVTRSVKANGRKLGEGTRRRICITSEKQARLERPRSYRDVGAPANADPFNMSRGATAKRLFNHGLRGCWTVCRPLGTDRC